MAELGLAPLRTTGIGMVLVIADLRFNGLDVVPDPLGWLVVATGAARMVPLEAVFRWSTAAAVLALLLSVPDMFQPLQGWLSLVDTVLVTGFVFATCTGVARVCPPRRTLARRLRWWDLGLTVAALLLGRLAQDEAGLEVLVVPLVVAALVVVVWFVVLLFQAVSATPIEAPETR